jgi:hypothetical protein
MKPADTLPSEPVRGQCGASVPATYDVVLGELQ